MRRRSVISLTPLIDVVFILLVFFMLATSFLDWRAIDIGVARSGGGTATQGTLFVEVRADGLRLAGRSVDAAGLHKAVRARASQGMAPRALIKTGDGVMLQRTVHVIDNLTMAGVTDISFVMPSGE